MRKRNGVKINKYKRTGTPERWKLSVHAGLCARLRCQFPGALGGFFFDFISFGAFSGRDGPREIIIGFS